MKRANWCWRIRLLLEGTFRSGMISLAFGVDESEFGAHNPLLCVLRPSARSATGTGRVQRHGGANESLQRLLVYLLALVKVDGTPCVPVKTGVEEARRVLQSRPFGEGHLHDILVRLTRADQSVVRPDRNTSPLPLLDDFGIGCLDQGTEPAEHLPPPVAELLDSRVDQLRS